MGPVRAFLVDDHPAFREGIRRLLDSDTGVEIVGEAESAEECLKEIGKCPVDVVLMDVNMPGIGGIQATRQLKKKYPDVKVIVLSTFGEEYLDQAIEAGANGYLLKTVTKQELATAVIQAAGGQSPIDARLTTGLLDRLSRPTNGHEKSVLTNRQREILLLIADGVPSKKIEEQLAISQATLTRQLRHTFDLLGVDDRAHAVAEAYRRGIL